MTDDSFRLIQQKDQLFDDWIAFTKKHGRCPRIEEIAELSQIAFDKRRAALAAEDQLHPHLSILEAPLDAIQVKNLVNNEKRRRAKLVSQYPSAGEHQEAPEPEYEPAPQYVPSAKKKAVDAPTGFAPVPKRKKAKTAATDSNVASQSNLPEGLSSVLQSLSGEASSGAPPQLLSAALTACQQVLQAQQSAPGSGLDLHLLQESLQQALATQLQAMTPQQQLALWQLNQQQAQQPMQQLQNAQLQLQQQAIAAALTQQPSLAQTLMQLPGMQNSPMIQNSLLQSLSGSLGQQQQQQQQHPFLGGLSGFAPPAPPTPVTSQAQQPSLSQVMQLMQMLQKQQNK